MKTRLLLAVAGLAIGFSLPTFAQEKEPTLSEQEQAEKTAVDHALSAESDAFGRGDLSAIGQHCNVPFVVISSQGVKVCATMSEIEAFFGDVIRDLRARGYAYSTRSEMHVKLLDQTTALASAVAVRHSQLDCMVLQRTWKRADGSELGLSRALQDSGGHATAEVHRRCKDRAHVLWPYRGSPDLTGPWKRGTDTVTHARLVQGNANYYKAQLANKLEITAMD